MLQPPVSDLAPWRPGHWITETGYALNERDVTAGTKSTPIRRLAMLVAIDEVNLLMEKVMDV